MGKLLIAAACLFLLQSASPAEEPATDPIKAKITAAKDAYYAERDKAEKILLDALTRRETTAKQTGDLKTLESVRAEIDAFRKEGKLPKLVPITSYETAMKIAATRLESVYRTGIKTNTIADRIEDARLLQGELDYFLKTRTIASIKPMNDSATKQEVLPGSAIVPEAARSEGKSQRIRVLTLNSRHADSGLDKVANTIKAVNADLVALQAVDRNVGRSGRVDQPAELAKLTKLPYSAFGNMLNFGGGEYGNAILSRWPIKSTKTLLLPQPKGGEARNVLLAEIVLPDNTSLVFGCTGFDKNEENQEAMAEYLSKMAESQPKLSILLGAQLMKTSDQPLVTSLNKVWKRAQSENTVSKQIEYILFHPEDHFKIISPEAEDKTEKFEFKPIWAEVELK